MGNGDSVSHFGHAILFSKHHFATYRTPSSKLCPKAGDAVAKEQAGKYGIPSSDVCDVTSESNNRIFYVNWQDFPQPYPPGAILYSAPEAWLFAQAHASLQTISIFTRIKYLAAAHAVLLLLARVIFCSQPYTLPGHRWLNIYLFSLVYFELAKWSLSGFYDSVAIAALVLGVHYVAKKRGLNALVALSIALFLHYRALWYAPFFAVALWQFCQELRRKQLSPFGTSVRLAIISATLGVSAYTFCLLYPWLEKFPPTNPLYFRKLAFADSNLLNFGWLLGAIITYLIITKRWLLVVTIAWQSLVLTRTPQTMFWHSLFLIPNLAIASLTADAGAIVGIAALYGFEARFIFDSSLLPGRLLTALM